MEWDKNRELEFCRFSIKLLKWVELEKEIVRHRRNLLGREQAIRQAKITTVESKRAIQEYYQMSVAVDKIMDKSARLMLELVRLNESLNGRKTT